jgi:all-trans-retinol 13,14-reductase
MYDVVIAGSGLGGLLCGYILSKEGYSVCILEKNKQLGGCLQDFKRNNCIFDTGMHYLGSLDEGQLLWRFFNYFDLIGKIKLRKLDMDVFDLIHIEGEEFKYAQGHDNFIDTLLQYFPNEKEGLTTYISKLKEIRHSFTESVSDKISVDNMPNLKYYSMNAADFINSVTSNKKLRNVLAASNTFYAGHPDISPLYLHAAINNSFIESSYRLVDGGAQIADRLAESIIAQGGVIMKNMEVEQFEMDKNDGHIERIKLANTEYIYGKYFISNIHPLLTFAKIKSRLVRKAFLSRINSIEHSIGIFSLYIVMKENSYKYFNYNYYHYESGESTWGTKIYDKTIWPGGFMLYTPASSYSLEYADCVNVITYMKYEELKQWENTTVENRGDDYKAFKIKKAELLLDLIEKRFPGFRSQVKTYYTSTPLTYRDYTGTVKGSIYGIMKDCNNPLNSFLIPRTKIPNLYLTGQNINLHGVLGVSVGSIITCGEFVGSKYLFNKINKA